MVSDVVREGGGTEEAVDSRCDAATVTGLARLGAPFTEGAEESMVCRWDAANGVGVCAGVTAGAETSMGCS